MAQMPDAQIELEIKPMKWEYAVKDLYTEGQSAFEQSAILNHYGKDDWELVAISNSFAYFKRPIWKPE